MKFFTTIPVCKHVVTPSWLNDSSKEDKFLGKCMEEKKR
jgi:hypothetical protein